MNPIDEYINGFPEDVRQRLLTIREIVLDIAPEATEQICMRMPTFYLNGKWLLHYAAYSKHIGFYPQPDGVATFMERLGEYKTSKGTIQFPLNKPLPIDLIRDIATYKVNKRKEEQ
jgi:uncharacterized protein YdhG (YjbR/CyaY superfamily)